MNCVTHIDVAAAGVCVGCGKFFCKECLQEIKGKYYCKKCTDEVFDATAKKIESLENKQQPMVFMNAGGGGGGSSSSSSSSSAAVGAAPVMLKRNNRSKGVAALLAFFLGWIGIHKFYLGKGGQGLLYLIFCWTAIPAIIAFIEFIMYLVMSQDEFDRKYNY